MSINPKHDIKYGDFTNYDDIDYEKIKPIFVSRMPNKKVTGQAHEETIYSNRKNGIVVVKKKLNQLSKNDIEDVCNKVEYRALYLSDKIHMMQYMRE